MSGPYGVGLWKSIRREWLTFSRFDVSDDARVKFWHDLWCGASPLKEAFPELYIISRDKESSIGKVMQVSNEMTHWDVQFTRSFQDWELKSLAAFMDLIYSRPMRTEG